MREILAVKVSPLELTSGREKVLVGVRKMMMMWQFLIG